MLLKALHYCCTCCTTFYHPVPSARKHWKKIGNFTKSTTTTTHQLASTTAVNYTIDYCEYNADAPALKASTIVEQKSVKVRNFTPSHDLSFFIILETGRTAYWHH